MKIGEVHDVLVHDMFSVHLSLVFTFYMTWLTWPIWAFLAWRLHFLPQQLEKPLIDIDIVTVHWIHVAQAVFLDTQPCYSPQFSCIPSSRGCTDLTNDD